MIAVDTSAIMAILQREPEEPRLRRTLETAGKSLISTANLLELQLVIAGRKAIRGFIEAEIVLAEYRIHAHPFDEQQLRVAQEAAVRYGKGRHKAALNFGDCFAYALAKTEDLPLLCTGQDFAATGIAIA